MEYKTTLKTFFSFFTVSIFAFSFGFGQSIFDNSINGSNPGADNPYITGQNVDGNISVSGIGRGPGVNMAAATNNRYNATSWNTSTLDLTAYFEFTLTPNSGYEIDFVSLEYTSQRSTAGPSNIEIRSSLDGYTSTLGTQTLTAIATPTANTTNLSIPTLQNISTSITFRIYGWGGSDGLGTFSINDFIFNGSVTTIGPCGGTPTTWNGSSWNNGTPDLSTPAVINGNYNTGANGSFSACSLTVNTGFTLAINDEDNGSTTNDYIVVQNDVTIDGTITLESKAAFVQLDDSGIVNGSGTAQVSKLTAPMKNWYEYTYWSSPVTGAQIGVALADSDPNRRFIFRADNYLDAFMESNNNNTLVAGQDGIDDNGDDWERVNSSTVMTPGVGYAATHSEAAFIAPPMVPLPYQFRYIFTGLFNNGVIPVTVYRNDLETYDNNWNLIGNPYPSAIDADLFLGLNATTEDVIDGALFLWSQNTAPSSTTNGNEQLNFSSSDYAIINNTGQIAGGDGVMPERIIPSGQAFFVSMSDSYVISPPPAIPPSIYYGDVIFNNSMRIRGAADNSQFFKTVNSKESSKNLANKLWLNLTSDNGVFNQTLVGYVDGATNADDGTHFDTEKVKSAGISATMYSLINNSSSKFAIQGKDATTLSETETIKLGFATTINVATLYTISIAQFQGDFLNDNAIYLKDNVTGKIHNLKECDYTFTSEVGEFNDRFVVMFNKNSLSISNNTTEANTLKIIDLDENHLQFTVPNNFKIKTVSLFDLLGREIYRFKGQKSSETYTVLGLNQTIYIAKVTLSNGELITKKALKK